jgi:hypothetical protein
LDKIILDKLLSKLGQSLKGQKPRNKKLPSVVTGNLLSEAISKHPPLFAGKRIQHLYLEAGGDDGVGGGITGSFSLLSNSQRKFSIKKLYSQVSALPSFFPNSKK